MTSITVPCAMACGSTPLAGTGRAALSLLPSTIVFISTRNSNACGSGDAMKKGYRQDFVWRARKRVSQGVAILGKHKHRLSAKERRALRELEISVELLYGVFDDLAEIRQTRRRIRAVS